MEVLFRSYYLIFDTLGKIESIDNRQILFSEAFLVVLSPPMGFIHGLGDFISLLFRFLRPDKVILRFIVFSVFHYQVTIISCLG